MKLAKVLAGISSVGTSLFFVSAASADITQSNPEEIIGGIQGKEGNLMDFIKTLINWGIGIAALVCVVMLIFAGYTYITASGEEEKIQKATKTLTWAIVGLVVCFIAVILVQFVLKNVLDKK